MLGITILDALAQTASKFALAEFCISVFEARVKYFVMFNDNEGVIRTIFVIIEFAEMRVSDTVILELFEGYD